MTSTQELSDRAWALLDAVIEVGEGPSMLGALKDLIAADPKGAARRASGRPQYDHQRGAHAAYRQLVEARGDDKVPPQRDPSPGSLTAQGGEHERTPDGGGDQPQPHPEQFALANDCS